MKSLATEIKHFGAYVCETHSGLQKSRAYHSEYKRYATNNTSSKQTDSALSPFELETQSDPTSPKIVQPLEN